MLVSEPTTVSSDPFLRRFPPRRKPLLTPLLSTPLLSIVLSTLLSPLLSIVVTSWGFWQVTSYTVNEQTGRAIYTIIFAISGGNIVTQCHNRNEFVGVCWGFVPGGQSVQRWLFDVCCFCQPQRRSWQEDITFTSGKLYTRRSLAELKNNCYENFALFDKRTFRIRAFLQIVLLRFSVLSFWYQSNSNCEVIKKASSDW